MGNVLVLSATAFEQGVLREQVEQRVTSAVAGKEWVSGRMGGRSVLLVATGIGAVNAAHALTCALQARRPDWVLQVGVGGAYPQGGLEIGALALASEEWYGDLGVRTDEGWQGADLIGIPVYGEDGYNKFVLAGECLDRAREVLPEVKVGPFATVQECSGTDELGLERGARFGAVCENMEGAAAAHVCALYGVPFLELRAMSNRVEKRDREQWDLVGAVARAQEAAARLLESEI
jgi:futalosine hydrolase